MHLLDPWNLVFGICLIAYFGIRRHFIHRLDLLQQEKTVSHLDQLERSLLLGMAVTILALPLIYLLTPLLFFADYQLPLIVRGIGLLCILVSLWLFWHSHADLGKNWSLSLEIRRGHQLVSHGVYSTVRHPMYASIWLWVIGQGCMLDNWLAGWAATPVFAAMYFTRIPREEGLMLEKFGEDYQQYMLRTGRLLPRWRKPQQVPIDD